jgi:hypothetical protein
MKVLDTAKLPDLQRKALSTFQLGSGFMLPPEMNSQVLSCIEDETNIAGAMGNITTSANSVKFMVDNAQVDTAAWACDGQCFPNTGSSDIAAGLGELEIKPEALRYTVCASRDLVEDASANVETWLLSKVPRAFGGIISNAIVTGDGLGKPLGILNPASGIPVCDCGDNTPAGQVTWQDLIMLKYSVPVQYQGGRCVFDERKNFCADADDLGRHEPTFDDRVAVIKAPARTQYLRLDQDGPNTAGPALAIADKHDGVVSQQNRVSDLYDNTARQRHVPFATAVQQAHMVCREPKADRCGVGVRKVLSPMLSLAFVPTLPAFGRSDMATKKGLRPGSPTTGRASPSDRLSPDLRCPCLWTQSAMRGFGPV